MFVIFGRCWMADCCLHTTGSRPAGMIVKFVIYRFKVKKVQEDTIPKSFCTFFTIQSGLRQTWRPRPRPAPPSQDTEDFNTDYRSCFNESSDNNNTTELVMVTSSWQLVMEADIKKCRKNEKDLCVKFNSLCEKLEKEIIGMLMEKYLHFTLMQSAIWKKVSQNTIVSFQMTLNRKLLVTKMTY